MISTRTLIRTACVLASLVSATAQAALPIYAPIGTENPDSYSFVAANTGNIVATFAGHTAGFTNLLGLEVNGIATGGLGLNNQLTSIGTTYDFGPVNAGDALTFFISVQNTGLKFYSDKSRNVDGLNHVFATPYAGGDLGLPAGTYVGFEDLRGGGDKDYDDLRFIFSNVSQVAVPEPTTWAMLIAGFGMVGFGARRRRGIASVTA